MPWMRRFERDLGGLDMRSEWEKVKIADICKFQNGFAFKSSEFSNTGIPVIKIKEIKDGEIKFFRDSAFINVDLNKYEAYQVEQGDVLFALTGDPVSKNNPLSWVGRVSKYRGNRICLLNQRVCKVLTNETRISKDYLFYYFRIFDNFFSLAAKATGSANQANISTKTIEATSLLLPPLSEQRAIVSSLSCLDDKIEINNKINANLEEQAQAIFKSWFVDFEPFQSGEFVDSELGRIPRGWRVGILSDIAEITMGQSPKGDSYNKISEGTIFFQGRGEFGNRFPTNRLYTTEPKRMAKKNDILMSVRAPVGDINVAKEDCCIGRGLAAIRSNSKHQSFLLYLLYNMKSRLDKYNGEGTVFGSINKKDLHGMKVIIPHVEVLNEYESVIQSIDKKIFTLSQQNKTLTGLRDTLLPKLMSGEIVVPVLDDELLKNNG